METTKHEVISISRSDLISDNFSGAANIVNTEIPYIVYTTFGLAPKDVMDIYKIQDPAADANAFAYMFRRFGCPTSYCDDYKQIGEWYLTTPMEGLFLTVYPFMGLGFGYVTNIEGLTRAVWSEQRKPVDEYFQRMKSWAKETHAYNLYSPSPWDLFGLEIEGEKDKQKFKLGEEWDIAVKEYNAWQAESGLPEVSQEEEMNRFLKEFKKFKTKENKKIIELYTVVELRPEEGESLTLNKVIEAISFTAKDLLRYTNVRDVNFNILGFQNDDTDNKLCEHYGVVKNTDGDGVCEYMYASYADPNKHIEVYLKGLEKQNAQECDATVA